MASVPFSPQRAVVQHRLPDEPRRHAGRGLTTAEIRAGKPDRHAFAGCPRRPIRIVLDGVRQGYNIGALLRLCDAFLCERLVICGRETKGGMRKLVQAAQGTQNWVPWEERECAAEAVLAARKENWRIVAIEQTTCAVDISQFTPRFPVCLVLGSERKGVSPRVLDLCDAAVALPMHGMANSLNVATAAAIVLHSLTAPARPAIVAPGACRTGLGWAASRDAI